MRIADAITTALPSAVAFAAMAVSIAGCGSAPSGDDQTSRQQAEPQSDPEREAPQGEPVPIVQAPPPKSLKVDDADSPDQVTATDESAAAPVPPEKEGADGPHDGPERPVVAGEDVPWRTPDQMIGHAGWATLPLHQPAKSGTTETKVVPKSMPFIAVRGVLRRTTDLGERPPFGGANALQPSLIDFELQFQVADDANRAWGDVPWQAVDVDKAMDVLRATPDFAADVVGVSSLEPVITMPLPIRADQPWGDDVTHPGLKPPKEDDVPGNRSAPRVTLFRYLDFTVKPGKTYRYRVRLLYAGVKPGAPKTHWSSWSAPCRPVSVPAKAN